MARLGAKVTTVRLSIMLSSFYNGRWACCEVAEIDPVSDLREVRAIFFVNLVVTV